MNDNTSAAERSVVLTHNGFVSVAMLRGRDARRFLSSMLKWSATLVVLPAVIVMAGALIRGIGVLPDEPAEWKRLLLGSIWLASFGALMRILAENHRRVIEFRRTCVSVTESGWHAEFSRDAVGAVSVGSLNQGRTTAVAVKAGDREFGVIAYVDSEYVAQRLRYLGYAVAACPFSGTLLSETWRRPLSRGKRVWQTKLAMSADTLRWMGQTIGPAFAAATLHPTIGLTAGVLAVYFAPSLASLPMRNWRVRWLFSIVLGANLLLFNAMAVFISVMRLTDSVGVAASGQITTGLAVIALIGTTIATTEHRAKRLFSRAAAQRDSGVRNLED